MPRSSPQPPPHPPPPRSLNERALPVVHRQGPWWRIHRENFSPVFFGKTGQSRYDDPKARFGVLYMACEPDGAFIETFGWTTGQLLLGAETLARRRLCQIWANQPLRLVDLSGPGLALLGADGRVTSGPHAVSQRWSAALYDHPDEPDGLLYRARHDPSTLCVALYERAGQSVLAGDRGRLDDEANSELLGRLLDKYGLSVDGP